MAKRLPKEKSVRKWQAVPAKTQERVKRWIRSEWLKNQAISNRDLAKLVLEKQSIEINHKTIGNLRKDFTPIPDPPAKVGELITQPENWTSPEAASMAENLKDVAHWLAVIEKKIKGQSSLDRLLNAGSDVLSDRFKMQRLLAHFVTNWLSAKGMHWIPDSDEIGTVLAALRIVMLNEHELTRLASVIADNVDRTAPEEKPDPYKSGIDGWANPAPEAEPVKPTGKQSRRKAKRAGQKVET